MRKTQIGIVLLLMIHLELRAQNAVYVNDEKVPLQQLKEIQRTYNIKIGDGTYWYDALCGAWGFQNGPTQGFIPAHLAIGGRLKAKASKGNTGVFVNRRQLPIEDVRVLQRIIKVVPGRFWLDDKGNGGYEGQQATFNLLYLSQKKGSSSFYRNSYIGVGGGSSGGTSYVLGKDWSVITN